MAHEQRSLRDPRDEQAQRSAALTRRGWLVSGLSALALSPACAREADKAEKQGAAPAPAKRLRIAMVPKGTTHEFWKSVHAGAVKAAQEQDVELVWKGPLREDDLKGQIDIVQSFTAQGVSAIALAPLNDKALQAVARAARAAGITVIVFDSGLAGSEHQSFVATDNFAAGKLAGERLAQLVKGEGGVLLLRYQEGSASTREREEGFLEALKAHPKVMVKSANQYGGASTESAFAASESLLLAQGAAKGQVSGIFCPNESTTFGMLLALRKAGLAGKLRFVGFDASQKLEEGVAAGEIDALVLQDPFRMGYLTVGVAVDKLKGKAVPERVDTGAALIDRSNLGEPRSQELLRPDLEKWLGKSR
jgi:ribose transport system substrate-binding protein